MTIVVFGVSTWVCGALLLPHVVSSPGIRWAVAPGCGVAIAALAALWGHSFATRQGSAASAAGGTVIASGDRSIAVGGDVSGIASTGDRSAGLQAPVAGDTAPEDPAGSGSKSAAVGGDASETAHIGDSSGDSCP